MDPKYLLNSSKSNVSGLRQEAKCANGRLLPIQGRTTICMPTINNLVIFWQPYKDKSV